MSPRLKYGDTRQLHITYVNYTKPQTPGLFSCSSHKKVLLNNTSNHKYLQEK